MDENFERAAALCALQQDARPSAHFIALRSAGVLERLLPELDATAAVAQNPAFHPEGDVFVHTMRVVDAAAVLRPRAEDPAALMLAALFHDLGKLVATKTREDGRIVAYGHDLAGLPLVERAMRRLTEDEALIATVVNHSWLHMRPNILYGAKSKKSKTRTLFDLSVCPNDLILLARADAEGTGYDGYDARCEDWLRARLGDYRRRMAQPHMTDAELIDRCGVPEALLPRFSKRARQLHLCGLTPANVERQLRAELAQALSGIDPAESDNE